jgi:broad specificity phosphatase PhoE
MSFASAAFVNTSVESTADFALRIMAWWDSLITDIAALDSQAQVRPYNILVVAHGGFINGLATKLVDNGRARRREGLDLGIHRCFNCSISLIEIEDSGSAMVTKYGDIEHLDKEQLAQEIVEINAEVNVDKQS